MSIWRQKLLHKLWKVSKAARAGASSRRAVEAASLFPQPTMFGGGSGGFGTSSTTFGTSKSWVSGESGIHLLHTVSFNPLLSSILLSSRWWLRYGFYRFDGSPKNCLIQCAAKAALKRRAALVVGWTMPEQACQLVIYPHARHSILGYRITTPFASPACRLSIRDPKNQY